jgi:hypothetical protein
MNTTLHYQGTIQWKNKVFSRPYISVNDRIFPCENQLVIVYNGESHFVVVPYSNQERIAGVVEAVFERL